MEIEEDDAKAAEMNELDNPLRRAAKKRKLNNANKEDENKNLNKNEFLIYQTSLIDIDSDSDDQDDSTRDIDEVVEDEIRRYKTEKFSSHEKKNKLAEWQEDPLKYWQIRRHKFPILAALARRIFVIRPSQAPCENSFSLARFTLEGRRHQLSSKRFNDILYLNSKFKSIFFKKEKSGEFENVDDADNLDNDDDDCIFV